MTNCSIIARGRPTRWDTWFSTWPGRSVPRTPRLADATCTALQLANFWQDVARDLAIGRIYLPRDDRDRFGVAEADLRALRFTSAFAELMKFQVERTRTLFDEGRPLVPRMPRALAVNVNLFSRGGLAILDRIEAVGFDVLTARPALTRWTKVRLLGRAVAAITMARLRDVFTGGSRPEPRHSIATEPPHPESAP